MGDKKRKMLVKRNDNTFDKIKAHYINPEEYPLTETNQAILNRWNEVLVLRLERFTKTEIATKWKEEKDLSPAQAYIDIKNSELFFGDVLKANKEGAKAIWLEYAIDFLKRCVKKKDRANEAKALKMIAEYGDFKEEDNPDFNPEKLENVKIEFAIPKQYLKYLKTAQSSGVDDFNLTEPLDVDYEEIEIEIKDAKKE